MDIIIEWLKWCCIINGLILTAMSILMPLFSDFSYSIHSKFWFSGTKEDHKRIMFSFMAAYKLLFMFFNVVPYIASMYL